MSKKSKLKKAFPPVSLQKNGQPSSVKVMTNADKIETQTQVATQESNGKLIQLSDIEIKEIRSLDQQLATIKIELANFTIVVENQKSQYLQKITQLQQSFEGRIKAAAIARGIDPDGDPAVIGKWSFESNTMTFTHTPPNP